MANNYETLVLLSPELAEENRKGILDLLTSIVEREGGSMVETDDWGLRQLAYPVQKQTRGYYVRLVYAAPGNLVAELERNIRITDGIFKFMTVKLAAQEVHHGISQEIHPEEEVLPLLRGPGTAP